MLENKKTTTGSGADESVNYLLYPTLMPLPPVQRPAVNQSLLEKEIQHLLAEERTRLEVEIQQLLTESQVRTEAAVTQLLAACMTPAPAEQKQPTVKRKKQNRLGSVQFQTELSLDGITPKSRITEICFLNTLEGAQEEAADLSEAGDGGVLCWTEGTTQYIAGEGGVVGGSSCANLFRGYASVTAIRFDGSFDTSNVKRMYNMFSGCSALIELDISGWNTANVTDMDHMFYNCKSLHALDLSGWKTSNVTNMNGMLSGCTALSELYVSGWKTASVTDMGHMFNGCRSLTELNLSGWDTAWVTNMGWMFNDCSSLRTLNLSWWNTSNVKLMENMFSGCSALIRRRPFRLDTSHADTTNMYAGTPWA